MKVLRADGHIQFLLCEVVPALCAFNDDDQVLWISEPGECVPVRGVGLCVDERSWPPAWPVVLTRGWCVGAGTSDEASCAHPVVPAPAWRH